MDSPPGGPVLTLLVSLTCLPDILGRTLHQQFRFSGRERVKGEMIPQYLCVALMLAFCESLLREFCETFIDQ